MLNSDKKKHDDQRVQISEFDSHFLQPIWI